MALELTIDFFGLCAFVRRSKQKEVDVLLPDTSAHIATAECDHLDIPLHEARLLVSLGNLLDPPPAFFDRQVSLPDGHWFSGPLAGYKLTIAAAGTDALVLREGLRPEEPDPCPRYDTEDISWLAEMERTCGSGKVNPDSLKSNKNVSARVSLTEGSLHCASLSRLSGGIVIFTFDTVRDKTYKQALADRMRYTLVQKEAPELLLTSFDGKPTITLPLRGQEGFPIRAAVSHIPINPADNSNDHFHCYYSLAAGQPPHNLPKQGAFCAGLPQTSLSFRNPPRICVQPIFSE